MDEFNEERDVFILIKIKRGEKVRENRVPLQWRNLINTSYPTPEDQGQHLHWSSMSLVSTLDMM